MRFTKLFSVLVLAGIFSSCASGPPVPDWQMNAKGGMERTLTAYLSGNDRVAVQEFAKARSELASTGQFALVARAELIRCAAQVASLELNDCPDFKKLRQDAAAPEKAYADYLAGHIAAQDIALLPEPQRSVMASAADSVAATAATAAITDPLSRLVAAGVLLRTGRATPSTLALAVETASAQGWRRPLLAWLGAQEMRAEKAGETAEAERLRRRMDLVQQSKP